MMIQVIDIIEGTTVDGPGLRTSVYLAGCEHRCSGCHNPHTWPMDAGEGMSVEALLERIRDARFNVSFSGGDPMYQAEALLPLVAAIKGLGLDLWCYTGFTYEEVMADEHRRRLLDYVDVLVDGPFVKELRSEGLRFRGSTNQRLVDVKRSRPGAVVEWRSMFGPEL